LAAGIRDNSGIRANRQRGLPGAEIPIKMQHQHPVDAFGVLNGPFGAALRAKLASHENVRAALEVDLSADLRFGAGLLVLTPQRLLACEPDGNAWSEWALTPGLSMRLLDHGGVGTLELHDETRRVALWRFTLGVHAQALRLVQRFEQQVERMDSLVQPEVDDGDEARCAACHTLLPPDTEECPACARAQPPQPSTWVLLRLWRFARPYRKQLAAGFGLTLASTAATLVPPYLTIPLMDDILIPFQNGQKIDPGLVMLYLGGLLLSALLAWGLSWARTYILALVSERIGADLRTTTYEHLLRLSLDYFGGKRTGDLMARIGSETDRINVFLSLHALDFLTDVLMIVMTAAILFSINPWLALVTLVPLVNDRLNKTWSLFTPTVSLLTEIGLLVVWAFGIWLVSKSQITVGVLTAFIAYIGRFYGRLDSMSRIVSVTQKAAAGAKRIFDILDHVSNVPDPAQPVHVDKVQGAIAMRNVGFRYGSRAVIKDMDLDIRPGEMIGLVGHSGSGKSTLVNLICRFYDVSEGSIQIDGIDIRRFSVADYRRHIGLVLQEPFLFFGTIAENIAYGKPDATREEIVAAARAAHAHEFILRLPHGYDSLVGERGQGLSGGERQRISIARALLIDPKILILDEATSSVDTETEKEIQKALDNLVRGRTTIAIAHRLSTLRKADRLVVMDRGRIVEVGPHDELMAREGHYYRLYQAQARNVDTEMAEQQPAIEPLEKSHAAD